MLLICYRNQGALKFFFILMNHKEECKEKLKTRKETVPSKLTRIEVTESNRMANGVDES